MNGSKAGISFERAVAAVQQMMDAGAQVTHNEKLRDRLGHLYQFDVVIRSRVGGHDILGVIECKNWRRRVGTPEVDRFVRKARRVRANLTLLASRSGFTQPALDEAKHSGIGTLSLASFKPEECGFSLGMQCYAEVYRWKRAAVRVHLLAKRTEHMRVSSDRVTWRGFRIIDWFNKQLVTKFRREEKEGWMCWRLDFDRARRMSLGPRVRLVEAVTFYALRVCEKKTKWVRFEGDAFFDWGKGKVMVPPGGSLASEGITTDFSDWEDYSGEIPPSQGLLDWRMTAHLMHFDPDTDVVDLEKL